MTDTALDIVARSVERTEAKVTTVLTNQKAIDVRLTVIEGAVTKLQVLEEQEATVDPDAVAVMALVGVMKRHPGKAALLGLVLWLGSSALVGKYYADQSFPDLVKDAIAGAINP